MIILKKHTKKNTQKEKKPTKRNYLFAIYRQSLIYTNTNKLRYARYKIF